MSAPQRPDQIPPPPPGWWTRRSARIRRFDRDGGRWKLLAAAAVTGAVVGWLAAAVAGLLLQPRFTALELAAQRFAPDTVTAQPPVERLGPAGAFDRRYVVQFPAGSRATDDVVERARVLRWRRVDGSDDLMVFDRGGIRATVAVSARAVTVRTAVAPSVRRGQRLARRIGAATGAVLALVALWWWLRRRPRLRVARD